MYQEPLVYYVAIIRGVGSRVGTQQAGQFSGEVIGMGELRRSARLYITGLVLVAATVMLVALSQSVPPPQERALLAIVFALLQALAIYSSLSYGAQTRLSLHTSVIFAAVLLFPPGLAMLTIGCGTVLGYFLGLEAWEPMAFNTAQTSLQAGVAGSLLATAGWSFERLTVATPAMLLVTLLAAAVMLLIDSFSVATIVGLQSYRSPFVVWRGMVSFDPIELLAQLALGLLAALIADLHSWALPLLLIPAVSIYRSTERQVRLREQTEQLAHQAFHDALTGLPNRALFMDRLQQALTRVARRSSSVAVLFLDLDRFKVVNDSLGHETGDKLLVQVAHRLRESLRPEDTISRHGGDEFTILLEEISDVSDASRVAQRISGQFATPFVSEGHEVYITISIGIALGTTGQERPEDLLRAADAAMYEAKRTGKDRYEVFNSRLDAQAQARLGLEADLRHSIERGELGLYYQPQVHLSSKHIWGMEALARWRHPTRGLIPPDQFIGLAEETGLILPLSRLFLEEACRQAMLWQEEFTYAPPLSVSVNLSLVQFRYPDLVQDIAATLERTGLPPSQLHLEITESVVMQDVLENTATLHHLKELGVQLAIDDFGIGYSSLSYLKNFPVDYLKIDRSFVAGLGNNPDDAAIVGAVVDLAHALRMEVVAEGVEREHQASALLVLGCTKGQGFLFSRPAPAPELARLLSHGYARA